MSPIPQSFSPNLLLSALPSGDLDLLQPHLTREAVSVGQILVRAHQPIQHVWFPEGDITSVTTVSDDGEPRAEVGLFGIDGFTGGSLLLGTDRSPYETFIQVDGHPFLKMEAVHFTAALDQSVTLRTLFGRFVHVLTVQAGQSASSNAHQRIEARLARWLLMCHDRVEGDEIELTHRFIAMMIAAERSGVTVSLHILEGNGLIRSKRGRVLIVDRDKLEELAAASYGVPEAEYRRLIGPFGKSIEESDVTVLGSTSKQ